MNSKPLVPVKGALIQHRTKENHVGRVVRVIENDGNLSMQIEWFTGQSTAPVPLQDIQCGLKNGMAVQDLPNTLGRSPLGEGIVVALRQLGGREQVLVDFAVSGKKVWLPWENLKAIRGVEHSFLLPKPQPPGCAEKLRLRCLAHALESWNENTGALSKLEIDPLPHQIHLVHHILASGNLNWLIADDVGLGKTIEVGMLLAALKQRGNFRRILIIAPAGLTRQWQQELDYKFGMADFQIFGVDFHVNDIRHWRLYNHVIGSIDLLKRDDHKELLSAADPWDIVIFDEAHRLSRRQWGRKIDASDRFRLAAELRKRTDSMLLLSGTPHQGMHDKFQAILELVRPELRHEIEGLALNPEILSEMVIRNRKADVTDVNGNFIFKGKTTHAISVETGLIAREFEKHLRQYLLKGYAASQSKGQTGVAIGFVMTIYRKLAASSSAAILRALERRFTRLQNEIDESGYSDEAHDERYAGEWEEKYSGEAKEFFVGELILLEDLIMKARELVNSDSKIVSFLDKLVQRVLESEPLEKILIFTEYRATQEFLANGLLDRFGLSCVSLIHGGQTQSERIESIEHFESEGQFLISTEAGGEGINLHRRCHVMVNFDLPWNPMRLVQRIGRLYRYGQEKRVVVFNVHAPNTLDDEILRIMYARISQVVADMSKVSDEFNEGLAEDIVGELSDVLEVDEILENALEAGIERTRDRIEEAVERAKGAVNKQRELFENVAGFDPNETKHDLRITATHARSFVEGMFNQLGIEIVTTLHQDLVMEIRLPESVVSELSIRKSRWRVTLDRNWASARSDIHMLDLESPLMKLLLKRATSFPFNGRIAGVANLPEKALLAAFLRWQNEHGRRMRQEFVIANVGSKGSVAINPKSASDWLGKMGTDGSGLPASSSTKEWLNAAKTALDNHLLAMSNNDLHPESLEWTGAAWQGESFENIEDYSSEKNNDSLNNQD